MHKLRFTESRSFTRAGGGSRGAQIALTSSLLILLCACAAARTRTGPGWNISSESSDYSPTMRLAVSLRALLSRPDSIVVVVDSGMIAAPGIQPPEAPADMSNLYMTALLTKPTRAAIRDPRTPPWSAIAESDSIHIADSLRLGEARRLPAMRFTLPRSASLDPKRDLLLFRITGNASTRDVHLANGTVIPARRNAARVRVYACAGWTLDGFVDTQRARGLAQAYSAAC